MSFVLRFKEKDSSEGKKYWIIAHLLRASCRHCVHSHGILLGGGGGNGGRFWNILSFKGCFCSFRVTLVLSLQTTSEFDSGRTVFAQTLRVKGGVGFLLFFCTARVAAALERWGRGGALLVSSCPTVLLLVRGGRIGGILWSSLLSRIPFFFSALDFLLPSLKAAFTLELLGLRFGGAEAPRFLRFFSASSRTDRITLSFSITNFVLALTAFWCACKTQTHKQTHTHTHTHTHTWFADQRSTIFFQAFIINTRCEFPLNLQVILFSSVSLRTLLMREYAFPVLLIFSRTYQKF